MMFNNSVLMDDIDVLPLEVIGLKI
jgi:hypothetical protein